MDAENIGTELMQANALYLCASNLQTVVVAGG